MNKKEIMLVVLDPIRPLRPLIIDRKTKRTIIVLSEIVFPPLLPLSTYSVPE